MIRSYLDAFWNEEFWLPSNLTWVDLEPGPGKSVTYTNSRHILLSLPLGLVLIVLRFILDKYLFSPVGKLLGIKDDKNKKAPLNPKLEAAYKSNPSSSKICALAKQLDMSERQVARWWRSRRAQDKPTTLFKFCDSAWRFTFYFYNFFFGVFALWNKDWLWDIDQCYIGYPHQGITEPVWWYYIVATAFYWSLIFTLFWDVKRKDFWQIVIHHFVTIGLLSFSWVCNLHRIGSLYMLSHDSVEMLLELAKDANYAGYQKFSECIIIVFTIFWVVSKLGIYPFHILRSIMVRSPIYMGTFPAYNVFLYLSCALLALYIFWTWLIVQAVLKIVKAGRLKRDIRSSSSNSDSSQSDNNDTSGGVNDDK